MDCGFAMSMGSYGSIVLTCSGNPEEEEAVSGRARALARVRPKQKITPAWSSATAVERYRLTPAESLDDIGVALDQAPRFRTKYTVRMRRPLILLFFLAALCLPVFAPGQGQK